MAWRGFGTNYGYNQKGGDIPYLTSLVPAPNSLIPLDGYIRFTLGVNDGLIDLTTVRITIASVLAFDGSMASFLGDFAGSDYVPVDNGYRFNLLKSSAYNSRVVTVLVEASTYGRTDINQSYQVTVNSLSDYPPVPYGTELNMVPVSRFTGEVQSGPLAGGQGLMFVSPSLTFSSSGNQIDLDSAEVATQAGDAYAQDSGDNLRPFLWGPPLPIPPVPIPVFPPQFNVPNYMPVWNDPNYGFLKTTQRSVIGVMHDTISLEDTVILY